ncbi:MAG TPA: nuclear transport factor 2 family protein [Flavobacterium sp.]|uniref:nuclear transport factor 2 family protein n=1 Tax=unclassified Flavobacterium TaxID=196869 RepID=UPI000E9313CF|nr:MULTISPECIES: nuclear transport factor 2 family protein [unclassified Flavobacterium]HBI02090.1 steroid delta-isomerase [Flavobacterium sp.]HRE76940.1 nuclear transport factor 2 family protein [Flavobacterium sp.]
MKNLLLITFVFFTISYSVAQDKVAIEKEAAALAQEQLDGYNKRDIEAFLKPYSENVKVYTFPDQLLYEGKAKMREEYTQMFNQLPDLNCKLVNRIVLNNKVIDHEEVVFMKSEPKLYAIAVYTITDGKISEVRFMQ